VRRGLTRVCTLQFMHLYTCNRLCYATIYVLYFEKSAGGRRTPQVTIPREQFRAGFKCVEALGRIIIRSPYPPSNAIIYMHLQL